MEKKVLITGGGRGIGFTIAEEFIRHGCRVMILGRNEKTLTKATDKLGENSDSVVYDLSNLSGVEDLVAKIHKKMVQNEQGIILNISSMASQYGIPGVIAYTAAKSAVEGMTRAMAVDLSPLGIRVNCIAPGFIKTRMSSKALDNDPARKTKVLSRTPMRRLGLPKEVAAAAYFLCSDQASFITGITLPVDGGNSIGF